jgi:alpha-N-arabinofuranosidase
LSSAGIKVDSEWTYNVSFWAKSASPANVTIELVSNSTGSLGSASFPALTSEWAEYTTTLKPSQSAADVHNTFRVSVNGDADASVYFALFSLFPPTYKGRANGMRIDLAETLAAVEPSIWRYVSEQARSQDRS